MERMTEAKQATESERTAETGRAAEMKKAADEARTFGYEKLMQDCALCPRACHVNRLSGRTGYCGQTSRKGGLRRGVFQRLSSALRVLPEQRDC